MSKIIANPDELNAIAAEIARLREEGHDPLVQKLNDLVEEINANWTGDAETSFIRAYEELKSSFTTFSERMKELADALKMQAMQYRIADQQE